MSTIQMALSIVGGMLIPVSVYGLRRKVTSTTTSEWQMPRCGMPSPDQSLRCKQDLGHLGWHEGGTKAWFGECWFVDEAVDGQRPRTEQPPMKKLKAKNPPRRPLTDKEKQEMKACDSGNWRLWDATERQFEYVGKIGTAWKPKSPQAKPPRSKPEHSDIIGPAPIRVRRGMFGTRRTLPNDQARESA